MTIWKGVAAVVLSVILVVLAVYSRHEQAVSQSPVMGIVSTAAEDDRRESQVQILQQKAEQSGFEVLSMPVERTQEAQIEAIRALIVYQVDVIVFTPIVESGWDSVLREAQDAAVPLIAVDKSVRQTANTPSIRYVGFDYTMLAEQAAHTLLQQQSAQRGILELYGTLNASDAREIARGCRDAFSREGLDVSYSLCGDGMRSRGYEILEELDDHLDEIGYIFAHNDAMALGAIDYLREHGRVPGRDIYICAFGGGTELMQQFDTGAVQVIGALGDAELANLTVSAAQQALQPPQGTAAVFASCRVLEGGAEYEAN